jgi:SAM-dependent methyltransferase
VPGYNPHMRFVVKPDTLAERIGLAFNLVPLPIVDTQFAIIAARAISAASECGLFSALLKGPMNAAELAACCGLSARAVEAVCGALTAARYLQYHQGRFDLSPVTRKWLAPQDAWSLHHYMPHVRDAWDVVSHLEDFLKTGAALDIHGSGFTPEQWARYQRAMRCLAAISAGEIAGHIPVRGGAARMLDIGGSHGYYSVALCRKHAGLTSTILDLPAAIEEAAPILARENMSDRVQHRAGDALNDDLGENVYEAVLAFNLVHHFTAEQNRRLAARVAKALAPGGSFVIQEMIRPDSPTSGDQAAQVLNLFFALTSTSGTWSVDEMESWMREAGLRIQRPVFLRTIPGAALIRGVKS